jgi:hypothetical protein
VFDQETKTDGDGNIAICRLMCSGDSGCLAINWKGNECIFITACDDIKGDTTSIN